MGAVRTSRIIVPVLLLEKQKINREAREANLNTSDYVRKKLGIGPVRKKRNVRQERLENPQGDPGSAVDVEELAKEIYQDAVIGDGAPLFTRADARREAKRRLGSQAQVTEELRGDER